MHRPRPDDLDPCPNCGDPVWRSHRCTAPGRPLVPIPADFREQLAREWRVGDPELLPELPAEAYDADAQLLPLDLDVDAYDRALREDLGL